MHKKATMLPIVVVALLLVGGWVLLNLRQLPTQMAEMHDGAIDLTGADMESTVALLPLDWEYYPGLHSAEDIAAGLAGAPRSFVPQDETGEATGTYRALLRLAPGSYSLTAYSLDYSTRVYVNGRMTGEVGQVSPGADGSLPRVSYYTISFTAEENEAEILLQYANFVHPEGGAMRQMALSTPGNIERYNRNAMLPTYLLSGGLLFLGLYNLLQFGVYRRREYATFALCCVMLALRSSRLVLELMPADYNWFWYYKGFYIGSTLTGPALVLLGYSLYPERFHKWVLLLFTGAMLVADVVILAIPIYNAVFLITPLGLLSVAPVVYCMARLFPLLRGKDLADKLAVWGLFFAFASLFVELLLARSVPYITRAGLTPIGLLVFVLCHMLMLGLRASESAVRLARERQRTDDLTRVDAMKTEFLANVSHELKTPLTVISGYAQDSLAVLETQPQSPEDISFNQNHIISVADRMDRMVNQLLDVAAIENGRVALNIAPVSLAELLRSTVRQQMPMLDQNGNRAVLQLAEGLPELPADRERIEQVLLNLLSNACRHTRAGVVTLRLTADKGWQEVKVIDSGEGMDAALRAQALKSYIHREAAPRDSHGMGLYICKKILDAHGGEIHIASEPGRGTEVWFRLPTGEGEEV